MWERKMAAIALLGILCGGCGKPEKPRISYENVKVEGYPLGHWVGDEDNHKWVCGGELVSEVYHEPDGLWVASGTQQTGGGSGYEYAQKTFDTREAADNFALGINSHAMCGKEYDKYGR